MDKETNMNPQKISELFEKAKEKEKSGVGDVHQLREKIAQTELEYKNLDAAVKQSYYSGKPADNSQFQKLADLVNEIKSLKERLAQLEAQKAPAPAKDSAAPTEQPVS